MSEARRGLSGLWAAPLAGWLLWFLVAPLGFVVIYSFLTRGSYGEINWTLTGANYGRAAEGLYAGIFAQSFALATLSTVVSAAIGLPMAYTMATARREVRGALFVLLMVPFLSNFIVRVYAIRILLGVEGPINALLLSFGVVDTPLMMTDSVLSVAIGMITNYLPFMVLPLYVVMEKMDFTLLEAARDLGASGPAVFWRVLLPLTRAGLASGSILVFIPVLGEFMIPDLLGGARTMLLGNLITEQFLKARHWPFGAALATMLVLCTIAAFALERRMSRQGGDAFAGR